MLVSRQEQNTKARATLVVPPNVTEINYHPAYIALRLMKILFQPNSHLAKIGPYTFSMTDLETFEAPASLMEIGNAAFYKCQKLKKVSLNTNVKIGDMCFWSTLVTTLNIPQQHDYQLNCNTMLIKILTLPEGLEEIKAEWFRYS